MNIDKIVEESWKKAEMNYGMSYHANGKSANFDNIKYAFMDGIRKGYKQARIETLNDVARGIDSDDSNESFRNELRIYIDTELKKGE